jgi:hypothetical protein
MAAWVPFAIATLFSTAVNVKQQKKIRRAEEERAGVERAVQGEEAARARRATIREAMVKRAEIENVAGAVGQQQSSAAISGAQGVTAQRNINLGDINTSLGLNNAMTGAQSRLLRAQQPSPLQQIGQAAQTAALSSFKA